MARSKYINTFNTTAEYDNYIESAIPEFPNVGYDKQAGKVNIIRQSPNDHLIYGEVVDVNGSAPRLKTIYNNVPKYINTHIDTVEGIFYADQADMSNIQSIDSLENMLYASTNIKNIKKLAINTSNVKDISAMFQSCTALETLNLYTWDLSSVTNNYGYTFSGCNSLTDVYIDVEATLNRLTRNLSSQGGAYIPSTATIHYDNGSQIIDYKWQNNAWTPQS